MAQGSGPTRDEDFREPGSSMGHHYVEGEWVEIVWSENGELVAPDGEPVREFTDFGRYSSTVIVDGERVHSYESTALSIDSRGRTEWRTTDGELAEVIDPTYVPKYEYTIVRDGQVEHRYGRSGDYTLNDDGELVHASELGDGDWADFEAFATYNGRRAVVGVDDDGQRVLLTRTGRPIDGEIDWDEVVEVAPGSLEGDPIAIGDYLIDLRAGEIQRVYLFPDGSQATRDEGGEYQRVIVPTDQEYPSGRPFFEGRFLTGAADELRDTETTAIVFSFPDGRTAVFDDGELVLVDMPIDTDYPQGPPVNCGKFPGGELFVFPDGRQLIQANDGTWGVGSLPDLPPFDDLVAEFGAPSFNDVDFPNILNGADWAVPTRLDDVLDDDITSLGHGFRRGPDAENGDDADSDPTEPVDDSLVDDAHHAHAIGGTALYGDGLDIGIINESVDGDPLGDLIADLAMPDSDGGIEMIDDPNDPFDDGMDDALDGAF